MEVKIIYRTSRSIVYEINDGGIYYSGDTYSILLDNQVYETTKQVINGIYNLEPDREYQLTVKGGQEIINLAFQTEKESFSLNVKNFGAKGDGSSDDTCSIQAAIMACPYEGRVYIPEGVYRINSIFLKSNLRLELGKGAVLKAFTEKERRPIIPGKIQSYDERKEYYLGTWEGNPLTMYAAVIQGMYVENVIMYGQGELDGNGGFDNWWKNPKKKDKAYRPRLIFLGYCKNVVLEGITVKNSPSWTIHPYFSSDLKFIHLHIENPKDSPNTDALDPESCDNVEIIGIFFSVGDDCIAIKSGKIYMGRKFKTPSRNIRIRQCCMEDGHGSVTIGSENAGGVKDIMVKECLFLRTDRGLRIKTRRGRGEDAVVDNILFENIRMDGVLTPFVINCFYFCDPDGHSSYVQSKEFCPPDERTPVLKKLVFRNIKCVNCQVAAAYIYGLPERKIEEIRLENIEFSFEDKTVYGKPAMMDDMEEVSKLGVFIRNVDKLTIDKVQVRGQSGEKFLLSNINVKI